MTLSVLPMLQPIPSEPSTREHVATVTRKGQITIPARVRRHLNVNATSQLAFVIESNGHVQLKAPKYPTLESVMGAVPPLAHPLTLAEMRAVIDEDRAEHYEAKAKRVVSLTTNDPHS